VTRHDGGRLVVTQVRRDTPALQAGIDVDDEIVAVDEYRVRPEGWDGRLEVYRPGDRVTILVSRRERLIQLEATFAAEPPPSWRLEEDPNAAREQRTRLEQWLSGDTLRG
jgi:predicted metalloprotease with PDZ domain